MSDSEFDEQYEIICKKCKKKSDIIINERTNKPYTLCEGCRMKCGSKKKSPVDDDEDFEDMPKWKQIIFKKKKQQDENKTTFNVNLYENEPQTDDDNSSNANKNTETSINGEMIAGRVDNSDDVKMNLTSLTLNDKIKYIIDLLENKNINKKETTKVNNDDIVNMLDIILSNLKEMKYDTYNTDNDETITTINKSLNDITKAIDKINKDIKGIKEYMM